MTVTKLLRSDLLIPILTFVLVTSVVLIVQHVRRRRVLLHTYQSWGCQDAPRESSGQSLGLRKILEILRQYRHGTLLSYFLDLFREYGETYTSIVLTQSFIFTCNPQNIKAILVGKFNDYEIGPLRQHLFSPITPHGIFILDGNPWKAVRDLYTSQLRHTRSITDFPMQERHFQLMLDHIASGHGLVDIQELFMRLLNDTTTEFVLGYCLDSLKHDQSPEKRKVEESMRHVKEKIAKNGISGPLHWLLERRRWQDACKTLQDFVEPAARQALDRAQAEVLSKNSNSKLTSPLTVADGFAQNINEMNDLRDQLTSMVFAGVDPVVSLLSSTFYLLAHDERVFKKLRLKISEQLEDRLPTYDDVRKLEYLRHVFNEAMRLFPPVPFNGRIANKNTILPSGGGVDGKSPVFVEKGQLVFFFAWASHRNAESFGEDTEAFRPERWEKLKAEVPGYIPFQGGPRICPGQRFGLANASYLTIRLLQSFDHIEHMDPRGWRELLSLNLENANGLRLHLSKES